MALFCIGGKKQKICYDFLLVQNLEDYMNALKQIFLIEFEGWSKELSSEVYLEWLCWFVEVPQ